MDFSKRKRERMRQQLWDMMHHGRGHTGHAFNFGLLVLILLSISILPLELTEAFAPFHWALTIVEIILTSLFTIEYVLRVFAAPSRLGYAFSFFGIVDLLSIVPFYLGFGPTQYIRVIRLVRLFRIPEIEAAAAEQEHSTTESDIGLAPGELVEHVVTHHPILLLLGCIPTLLATSAAFVALFTLPPHPVTFSLVTTLLLFAVLFLWKAWLDYSYDVIYITSSRLISVNQHILGRDSNQMQYRTISNVKPRYPSVLSYLLRYGTLTIETPAEKQGHIEMTFVRAHERAAHTIMRHCAQRNGA